ncbi:MAG: hypothetical protein SP4CHLAM5_11380 [Chlamydiia bacterium]|nr:hypothetical protein [Chlamydiia bacterium]MCH9618994.1 hypothetical protein [Chlamydiia bacterium]MCH9624740.1 hypothetical protein [Chlamydiia bacterium]
MNKCVSKIGAMLMVCGTLSMQNLHGEEVVEQPVLQCENVENVVENAAPEQAKEAVTTEEVASTEEVEEVEVAVEKSKEEVEIALEETEEVVASEETEEVEVAVEEPVVLEEAAPATVDSIEEEAAPAQEEAAIVSEENELSEKVAFAHPRSFVGLTQLLIDIHSGEIEKKYSKADMVKIFDYMTSMDMLFETRDNDSVLLESVYGYENGQISSDKMLSAEERAEWFAEQESIVEAMKLSLDFLVGDLENNLTDEEVLARNEKFQASIMEELTSAGAPDQVKEMLEKVFKVFSYTAAE